MKEIRTNQIPPRMNLNAVVRLTVLVAMVVVGVVVGVVGGLVRWTVTVKYPIVRVHENVNVVPLDFFLFT